MTEKELKKLIGKRTDIIESRFAALEKTVKAAQRELFRALTEDVLSKLDVEGGRIKNTARNRQIMAAIDKVFNAFDATEGLGIAKEMVNSVAEILTFNNDYFTTLTSQTAVIPIKPKVIASVRDWLGIGERLHLVENGYLKKVTTGGTIRMEVQNMALKSVVSQQGWQELRTSLRELVEGRAKGHGKLEQYYRNYAYDTYSQVDRAAAELYAEGLGMNQYAIYEGGLIATSRDFCKARNGKVFTREEIAKFNPTEAKPPNYDPFRDLGGYSCRHHLNWIPYELAVILRPDLKRAA